MKILFASLIALSFTTILSAQIANDLEVFSDEGLNFTMYVNGRAINEAPQSNVRIENIHNDQVQIRIVFEDETIPEINQKYLQIGTPGVGEFPPVATIYKITMTKKKGRKLRFVSRNEKKIQNNVIILEK